MSDGRRELLDRVRSALARAGVPLADDGTGNHPGAVVRTVPHGVCVFWRTGTEPRRPDTGRVSGSTSVMSPEFQATLHLAAVLAHAGHQSDHLGDRVLITAC
ncbi:hypothetical protein [Kitasatospora paracochleata]|uniref:Uncharacterized protein n=1 Tax=Kitasatospora paracochleata TaxID=58354 RepID=A0ABT1J432_9ACTN|nr:hypothetical protein [Kitasatospora paracochleata]MCP2312182.1 hypothetical protein [Kitasatospora paracochleata]